jgi:NAD(P)-dependent dehydrogenase (short-subunit alcohol dehydrogenase family)
MTVSYDFSTDVAIITGAARGVGRTMVGAFVAAGCRVVAADRDEAGLLETAKPYGASVRAVTADVSAEDGADAIVDTAVREFGSLSFCINNAAVAPHTSLLEETVRVWDTVFAVNCRGTFLMTQRAARIMIDQGHGGRIINFSSGVTNRGAAGNGAYASSRAATETFTMVAAIELAPYEILVNCISPGLIDTQPKPLAPVMAERLASRIPHLPLARPGDPDEVASVALWLCSSGSTYVTGSVHHVDGGSGVGSRPDAPVIDDDVRYDWVTGQQRL